MGGYTLATRLPAALEARRLKQRLRDLSAPIGDRRQRRSLVKRADDGPLPALDRLVAEQQGRRLA